MKLVSKSKKRTTAIILIAVVAVIIAAVCIIAAVLIKNDDSDSTKREPQITGLNIASYPKTAYYVGETFDVSDILIQITMTEQSATYFIDSSDPELEFSGFDSSTPTEALTIYVSYKGYMTAYAISVSERQPTPPTLVSIRLPESFRTTYSSAEWETGEYPDFWGINLICTYSDGTEAEVPFRYDYVIGLTKEISPAGTCEFKIVYSESGVEVELPVTITITE